MSGMRVTGALHIGHYFGVLKNWVAMQDRYSCYFGAMDWHGMTTAYKNSMEIDAWMREIIADWIAWGVDPQKSCLFVQSLVPEHLELFMIFANLTPMGWLERVPSWKDAEEEAKASDTYNLGRFSYPVLQAADIAMYLASKVPVGADQVAHLELSREIIRRFNKIYKAKIPEPQAVLTENPLVLGLDNRKMSKSYQNDLPLTCEEKVMRKKIMQMVTDPKRARREDPGDPNVCNVYSYHKLYSSKSDLEWVVQGCTTAGIGCGDCKGRLAENINSVSIGPREKKKELLNNPKLLDSIIVEGSQRAQKNARETMSVVRDAMKFHSGLK